MFRFSDRAFQSTLLRSAIVCAIAGTSSNVNNVLVHTAKQVATRGILLASNWGWTRARLEKQDPKSLNNLFKAQCGAHPVIVAQLWEDLQTTQIAAAGINVEKRNVNLKNFLRTFQFLRICPTEEQRRGWWANSRNTIRKWCKCFLSKILAMKVEKVRWPQPGEWTATFMMSVDGVHCHFHEEQHPTLSKNPAVFSHKLNGPGLSHEPALHLWEPRLVWVKQNPITKHSDRMNFAEPGGLRGQIPDGHKATTDRGCRGKGGDPKVAVPSSHDSNDLRTLKARARMRQESFHTCIKLFKCIDGKFNHDRKCHEMCFECCCIICCHEMELINPLFDIQKPFGCVH